MAATSSKKGKKKKGQTIDLNSFLSGGGSGTQDGKAVVTVKSATSWADAMDAEEDDYSTPTQQIALPTAPRAARQEVDLSQLPDRPPYTAYVGNLSYDVDEESLEQFFADMKVSRVRLVKEGGRMKGFGYVEFEDKQSLAEALKSDGQTLLNRKLKVDLASQNKEGGGFGGDRDGRGGNQISGEGDADDDWRGSAAANKSTFESSNSYGRRDNGFGGRDDRDGGYGPPRDRYAAQSEADSSDSWSRGPPRSTATVDDRNGGYSRRGFDERDSGYAPPRRNYDDRGGYNAPRRGYDDRDSGYGRRDGPPPRYEDRGYDRQPSSEAPKERPRLQLAPRTKPADGDGTAAAARPAAPSANAAIFGAAKPVDTAAREREIEERLRKQQESSHPRGYRDAADHREDRGYSDSRDSGSYTFGSRDIRTDVQRTVYNTGDSHHSADSEREAASAQERPAPEPVKKPTSASIFGGAKPVDTAAREREIDERLRKERGEAESSKPDSSTDRRHESSRDSAGGSHEPPKTSNAWSRGQPLQRSGADSGRGGVTRPLHREKKERALPKSIDEMPVYTESESRDFSDKNKYAGLLGSDGDDYSQDD